MVLIWFSAFAGKVLLLTIMNFAKVSHIIFIYNLHVNNLKFIRRRSQYSVDKGLNSVEYLSRKTTITSSMI